MALESNISFHAYSTLQHNCPYAPKCSSLSYSFPKVHEEPTETNKIRIVKVHQSKQTNHITKKKKVCKHSQKSLKPT